LGVDHGLQQVSFVRSFPEKFGTRMTSKPNQLQTNKTTNNYNAFWFHLISFSDDASFGPNDDDDDDDDDNNLMFGLRVLCIGFVLEIQEVLFHLFAVPFLLSFFTTHSA